MDNMNNMKVQTKVPKECELILYHATTKENLKGILREGIRPGMSGGWCDLAIKQVEEEYISKDEIDLLTEEYEAYKQECKENIWLFSSLFKFEEETAMPRSIDTIIILCVPKDKVFVDGIPLSQWEKDNDLYNIYKRGSISTRETIPPENIIGCLNIMEMEEGVSIGNAKYMRFDWNNERRHM